MRTVAGYTEVALPDIPAGGRVEVVLACREPGFAPKNRAWLPLGAYLRTKGGVMALPRTETGVRVDAPPPRRGAGVCGLAAGAAADGMARQRVAAFGRRALPARTGGCRRWTTWRGG